MEIKSYGKTDIGRVRNNNEDYFAAENISDSEKLYIVADGMGGHKAGNIASKMGTVTFIGEFRKKREKHTPAGKAMKFALTQANKMIFDTANSESDKRGMGTTFSAMLINDNKATIIHVGDSRIYLIRNKSISKLTVDHTFVEKMLEEGRISKEEARKHPQKNILYMSLGAREIFNPFFKTDIKLNEGDIFILCSDGLTDMLEDNIIMEYCLSYPPKKAVEELVELGNRNGGIDNITVMAVYVGKTDSEDITHPIEVPVKKKLINNFFLKLALIFLALIILVFGLIRIISYSNNSKKAPVSFSTLSSVEMRNLSPAGINEKMMIDNISSSESKKILFSKKNKNLNLLFFGDFYIIKEGTGSRKISYEFSGNKIRLEKIFFDSSIGALIAIDDKNKIYRMKIKND